MDKYRELKSFLIMFIIFFLGWLFFIKLQTTWAWDCGTILLIAGAFYAAYIEFRDPLLGGMNPIYRWILSGLALFFRMGIVCLLYFSWIREDLLEEIAAFFQQDAQNFSISFSCLFTISGIGWFLVRRRVAKFGMERAERNGTVEEYWRNRTIYDSFSGITLFNVCVCLGILIIIFFCKLLWY